LVFDEWLEGWHNNMIWVEFLICASLMTFFAFRLCKEGVIVAEKTRLDEGVIGMFFLAVATSFPEIVTGATAVSVLGKIGLGFGDIVGSVIANFMILAALDYCSGKGRILLKVSNLNKITGIFVIFISAIILIFAFLRSVGLDVPAIKGVGLESVLIAVIYFAYLRIIKKRGFARSVFEPRDKSQTFLTMWAKFAFFLLIVMGLGIWMASIGEKIILNTTLTETFTGTLILGVATSLPEIIVSFTALRAGSVNMAVGNILGSNLFDLSIIPLFDALSRRPILGLLSFGQILAAGFVLILSVITIAGLYWKKETYRKLSLDTGIIFIVGAVGFVLLYFIQ